jgi:hypothetical protein
MKRIFFEQLQGWDHTKNASYILRFSDDLTLCEYRGDGS